jgi:hypothetical protein
MKLITLCGLAGAGKDTVGQYLHDHYGYRTFSFADSLKDCLAVIFDWDRAMLEGRTPESRLWREEVDAWWASRLGIPHFTPRFAMTNFGTDVMRKWFHDDIWILNTERKFSNAEGPVVLTDGRFPNELKMTRKLGGTILRVRRGDDPAWQPIAVSALSGDAIAAERMRTVFRVHESEWLWMAEEPDHVLDNSTDLPALYRQIDRLIEKPSAQDGPTLA